MEFAELLGTCVGCMFVWVLFVVFCVLVDSVFYLIDLCLFYLLLLGVLSCFVVWCCGLVILLFFGCLWVIRLLFCLLLVCIWCCLRLLGFLFDLL